MKKFVFYIACFLFTLIFVSCATRPYSATNKIYKQRTKDIAKVISTKPENDMLLPDAPSSDFIGTVNFGMRKPNYVIIHHTAQSSCDETLRAFTRDSSQVSAHYLICKDGTLHHMLNDYLRAWHAGAGKWGSTTDINSSSIGIELDNNGKDTFTNVQLHVLQLLLGALKKNYNIPATNFLGHADIAPARKIDPNVYFPWKQFADSGYGVWYGDTTNMIVPEHFNAAIALRMIGYDISNREAAIRAFRRHFLQHDDTGELSESEKKVLYALSQRFM